LALLTGKDANRPILTHVLQLDANDLEELRLFGYGHLHGAYRGTRSVMMSVPDSELYPLQEVVSSAQQILTSLYAARAVKRSDVGHLTNLLNQYGDSPVERAVITETEGGQLQLIVRGEPDEMIPLESLTVRRYIGVDDSVVTVIRAILRALITAIDDIQSAFQDLRRCEECGSVYLIHRDDARQSAGKFCTVRCGNRAAGRARRGRVGELIKVVEQEKKTGENISDAGDNSPDCEVCL